MPKGVICWLALDTMCERELSDLPFNRGTRAFRDCDFAQERGR